MYSSKCYDAWIEFQKLINGNNIHMHVYINTLDLTCKGRKIFFFLKEEKDTCGENPSQWIFLNFTYFLLLSFYLTCTYD